VSEGMGDVPK